MAITVSVLQGGANSHATTSEEVNFLGTDFVSEGVVGAITNTSGVAPATGAFAVNAQGTPDMTVAVSTGVGYVTATPTSGNSQLLRVKNSASSNVTIAANATGGTRYDWIYIKIDPDKAKDPNSGATDVGTLVASRSTSATTDNGTPPTYGYPLAVVTVANGASSITNGNIADNRTNAQITTTVSSVHETTFDFIASGCVWTADAAGSTRLASMTSGVVYINGTRLTVAAVTSRTFTASKDVYVDFSDNGDGTAALTYTDNTTNAASPALAANSVRNAIIVVGATNIAASTSINQGQESRVLPIASSTPYAVTDSLGNLICPRDPQRKILGYRQIVSDFVSPNNATPTLITGLTVPVIIPANRKVRVTLFSRGLASSTANNNATMTIWEGAVAGTQLVDFNAVSPGVGYNYGGLAARVYTPTSTSLTYNASATGSAAPATTTVAAGSTKPAYLMVELV